MISRYRRVITTFARRQPIHRALRHQLVFTPQRQFWWKKGSNEEPDVGPVNNAAEAATEVAPDQASAGEASEDSAAFLPVAKEPAHLKIKDVVVLPSTRPMLPGVMEPFVINDNAMARQLLKLAKENPEEDIHVGIFFSKKDVEESETEAQTDAETEKEEKKQSGRKKRKNRIPPNRVRISNLHRIGVLAQIAQLGQIKNPSDVQLLVKGIQRVEIDGVKENHPLRVSINHLHDSKSDKEKVAAFYAQIQKGMQDLMDKPTGEMVRKRWEYFTSFNHDRDNVLNQCDIAAYSLTSVEKERLQEILNELDVEARLAMILEEILREQRVHKVMGEVQSDVEKKLHDVHREHILKEHLKKIKKELGMEKDEKTTLSTRFRERLEGKTVPQAIMDVIEEELSKLSTLESASSEFNVTRNYLDWLSIMPYGINSQEVFDLKLAQQILDEDHYGMEDVKDRILEFIAVGKLKKNTAQGKIICLIGPPGVGKTSIGKSIARALGREFYRFSVGGLGDISEIKGHRRTYVGAMPGKFVQAFKRTSVENPLILVDEIDKLGSSHGGRGDAQSSLLEALDPNQNDSFLDHYLDVPLDLSKVLFLCTANDKSLIPGPLADRMEFVDLSGYLMQEKMEIAKRYLIKKSQDMSGLSHQVQVEDGALENLIRWYCREAGVRNLEKHIERIYRKCARKVVEEEEKIAAEKKAEEERLEAERKSELEAQGITEDPEVQENPEYVLETADGEEVLLETADGEEVLQESGEEELESMETETEAEPVVLEPSLFITSDNLKDYVGKPVFTTDRLYEDTPVGTTMGLAYTSMGGTTLYVESAAINKDEGKGGTLKTTGRLGESMSESTQIAFCHARAFMTKYFPENTYFQDHHIHLSVIEAATPKDGPSAGVTITTSLLSLALDRPVLKNFGLTGEISLTGRVLKIGGVREKIVAAKRSGCAVLCFPIENEKDYDELPEYVKEGLTVHFVDNYKEVFDIALRRSEDEF